MKMQLFVEIIKEILSFFIYLLSFLLWYMYPLSEVKNKNSKLSPIVLMSWFTTQNPILLLLKIRLEKLWYSVILPNIWLHIDTIEHDAKKVDQFLSAKHIKNYIYIWFSIGWIIGLYYKKNYPNTMKKLLSIWTPYHGTNIAKLLPFVPSAVQLLPRSNFLKTLCKDLDTMENIYSLWTRYDQIIYPAISSQLSTKNNFVVDEVGHFHLLFSKKIFEFIKKILSTS